MVVTLERLKIDEQERMNIASAKPRRSLFFLGTVLAAAGLLLVLSGVVTLIAHFGDFDELEARAAWLAVRAVGGIVLVIVGFAGMATGSRGVMGTDFVDDPEAIPDDMSDDTLTESAPAQAAESVPDDAVGVWPPENSGRASEEAAARGINIRCLSCGALNDPYAKFCDQCGTEI